MLFGSLNVSSQLRTSHFKNIATIQTNINESLHTNLLSKTHFQAFFFFFWQCETKRGMKQSTMHRNGGATATGNYQQYNRIVLKLHMAYFDFQRGALYFCTFIKFHQIHYNENINSRGLNQAREKPNVGPLKDLSLKHIKGFEHHMQLSY